MEISLRIQWIRSRWCAVGSTVGGRCGVDGRRIRWCGRGVRFGTVGRTGTVDQDWNQTDRNQSKEK